MFCYLEMIQTRIMPVLQRKPRFQSLWWMQDGATSHTAKIVMEFLQEKFDGRIISSNSENPWPARSPDLNPLDFWFWGYAQSKVHKEKPENIEEVQSIVENVARSCQQQMVIRASMNIVKRAQKCAEKQGCHFESEL